MIFPNLSPRVAPLEVGIERKEDVDRSLAPISEATRDGTAIVDPIPGRNDVDRSDAIGRWRVRQEDTMTMDVLGEDLESSPTGAVEGQALGTPGVSSYERNEAVRKPERSGREDEYLSNIDGSQCGVKVAGSGVKVAGNKTMATKGTTIRESHLLAPISACASPVRFVPNGATTSNPHEHRSLDVRTGTLWERGTFGKSSLSARSGVPGQCHDGKNPVRLKGCRNHSRDGGGGVRRCKGKDTMEGGDGADGENSPVKVESEWENTLARNILSLYQTKLKAELDVEESDREEGSMVSFTCSLWKASCEGSM